MDTRDIWFTSDQHLDHNNIRKYCNRPFPDVKTMDDHIIRMHNSVIRDSSIVYCLGDTAFNSPRWKELRGNITFLKGNHDRNKDIPFLPNQIHEMKYDGRRFILCHFPLESWNAQFHGSIHIHGHVHNNKSDKIRTGLLRYNVSVDVCNFTPVHISQIMDMVKIDDIKRKETYKQD